MITMMTMMIKPSCTTGDRQNSDQSSFTWGRMTAAHGQLIRIRQVAPMCTPSGTPQAASVSYRSWLLCSFRRVAGFPSDTMWPGPRSTSVPSSVFIHPAVWPQYKWAKNRVGAVPFSLGQLSPHRTQNRLGPGLPPYQVSSQSVQPFGHNGHWPKIGDVPL